MERTRRDDFDPWPANLIPTELAWAGMVVRTALLLALFATATLSGCLDDDSSGGGAALDSIPSGSAPTGEGAGTPASHGNHDRSESAVTVSRNSNGDYIAKKTVTLTNDFGGAANADVELTTRTGGVQFKAGEGGGYEIVASLEARAATEQLARQNLALLKVVHSDRLGAGRLSLDTEVQFPNNVNNLVGGLVAKLPASPSYRLTGLTNTGGAQASGLGGSLVSLSTDTGGVDVAGAFNTATLQADTGGIRINGVYNVVKATTDTGGINARIESSQTGSITLDSDTGGIDLRLLGPAGVGYDVQAEADTGGVSIAIGPTTDVGTQSRDHKHVRSAGFDEASIQVTVVATTSTGGVSVSA